MESKVELLVSVRTWEAMESVILAGADAVELNSQSFIFSQGDLESYLNWELLEQAVAYAHAQNVKVYVAVNTLLSDEELEQIAESFSDFEQIGVDGVGIRDLAMLNLVQKMEPAFLVYADHRMQISNLEMMNYLQDRGVGRVEVAQGISLPQLAQYVKAVDLEITYVLGQELNDPQSQQALHSGVIDLLEAKVSCIKIPGETEEPSDLASLIRSYRQLILQERSEDGALASISPCDPRMDFDEFRELSISWVYGDPWAESVQSWLGREMESEASLEGMTERSTRELKEQLVHGLDGAEEKMVAKVTVAVPTFEHFLAVLEAGAERILIDGDYYLPGQLWSYEEIATAINLGYQHNCEVIYRTPGVVMEAEMYALKEFFELFRKYHLRVMTGDPGVVEAIYGADLSFTLFGDLGLEAFNSQTFHYLKRQGYDSAIISPKSGVKEVCLIGRNRIIEVEMLAQGPVPGMGSDVHLALLPVLGELTRNGISNFRIEGAYYAPEDLVEILKLYRQVIRFDYDPEVTQEALAQLQDICQAPLTYGALVPTHADTLLVKNSV